MVKTSVTARSHGSHGGQRFEALLETSSPGRKSTIDCLKFSAQKITWFTHMSSFNLQQSLEQSLEQMRISDCRLISDFSLHISPFCSVKDIPSHVVFRNSQKSGKLNSTPEIERCFLKLFCICLVVDHSFIASQASHQTWLEMRPCSLGISPGGTGPQMLGRIFRWLSLPEKHGNWRECPISPRC